jgi:hypothetical protein
MPNLEDVLKNDWLKSGKPPHINSTDQLGMLWVQFGPGGPFDINAQTLLSTAIQSAFGVSIQPAKLTATMTFAQLAALIGV